MITRNWGNGIERHQRKFTDVEYPTEISESREGTVIRSAYKAGLKSRLIARHGTAGFNLMRKMVTLRDELLSPYVKKLDEFGSIQSEAEKYIVRNDCSFLLATGNPFGLFRVAHRLSKKYNIPWMADYRDPFSGNATAATGLKGIFMRMINLRRERIWTSNTIHFTTVSEPWLKLIGQTIGLEGTEIRNGYSADMIPNTSHATQGKFVITYLGTVYDAEYVEIFRRSVENLLRKRDCRDLMFRFVGLELNRTGGTEKILKLSSKFPEHFEILPAVDNQKALEIASKSTILLNLNYGNQNDGVIPVKLYEYLALKKTIISVEDRCENIEGEFDKYLELVSDDQSLSNAVENMYESWKNNQLTGNHIPAEVISKYTREAQAEKMASLINHLI